MSPTVHDHGGGVLVTGSCGKRPLPREGDRRDISLSEAQVFGGKNGPVRSAMAFEYFRIAGTKDVLHGHSFQMRLTVSSESPTASDTMRQPEAKLPLGFTPTLRRTSIAS